MAELKETKPTTDQALKLLAEYENIRQQAIEEQLKVIEEAKKKLARLGHTNCDKASKPKEKPCPKCGELGHDLRFHRGDSKPAPNSREVTTVGSV